MTRRRFVYINGQGYEVGVDPLPIDAQDSHQSTDGVLWGDRNYEGLRASDGTDISSRSKHREYMKANNLAMDSDFTNQWAKQQAARDAYRTTGAGGAVTRDDIGRAIHQLEQQQRR